jgi:hypothetical protein
VTTLADLFATLKDDVATRYRSPIFVPFVVAFLLVHWRIAIFLVSGPADAISRIKYIEQSITTSSVLSSAGAALAYVLLGPWLELAIGRCASLGRRMRNDHQYEEMQGTLARRRAIASRQEALIELEMRNASNETRLRDTDLVKQYQSLLSEEHLSRWTNDLKAGPVSHQLQTAIANYIAKHDTVEGKFIEPAVATAHDSFVSALSTLNSAIDDKRNEAHRRPSTEVNEFAEAAVAAQREYRKVARNALQI